MKLTKETVKSFLRFVGLFEPARRLWIKREDIRFYFWNAGYRVAGAADGLPIPPSRLIYLATYGKTIGNFLHGGHLCHQSILFSLKKNDILFNQFESVLDFGCGCGRVMRYWRNVPGTDFYGTDSNPDAIAWCKRYLSDIACFSINQPIPPMKFDDEKFDFVYAISIFTHLNEELQRSWIKELRRVINPGGFLLITLHGENFAIHLKPDDQKKYFSGELVVINSSVSGTNWCAAYHPFQYVKKKLTRSFRLMDYSPIGERGSGQDIYLLQKAS